MPKRIVYMIMWLLKGVFLFSQNTSCIKFNPSFGESKLVVDSTYQLNTTDSIQITALRFYISKIELFEKNKSVWIDSVQFHLIDAFNEKTLLVNIPSNICYSKLKFNFGIDSTTNVSGAMGGDLDPTKGMYWTWQSGYINFKLEGTSNICKTRHNEFQFHLGGYQQPFNSVQTVFIEITSKSTIEININLLKIFQKINLAQQHHIMSPGQEAMDFSEKVIQSLSINK
ncbi:MAG: hypothetical protein IPL10_07215 [Bacteroidetes bacterium]|nr:hypothetical protein [Bacteroidota bacterium]